MLLILLILLLSCFHVTMIDYLYNNPTYYQLDAYTLESGEFRSMRLGDLSMFPDGIDYDELTALMIQNNYDLTKDIEKKAHPERILAIKPAPFRKLCQSYATLLDDLKYFPIPQNMNSSDPDVTYANGWMDERTYGGERGHEGCDIMGNQMPRGHYPVISMSDGVVEKVGWLEMGGWRVGIRAPGGAYLYYAHLYGYSRPWQEGDTVKAGELIGTMGDTGYSKVEGTAGNFETHLHVGIYLKTDHMDEMSVNPYWILKWLERNRLRSSY